MAPITFLSMEHLLQIHADQLAKYGGLDGFIDQNVVASALTQPSAKMFGEYLHSDIACMAAAYLFHFCASQGFVDGNKRTGAACTVDFLAMNGYLLHCTSTELYEVSFSVANNGMNKEEIADWIRERLEPVR